MAQGADRVVVLHQQVSVARTQARQVVSRNVYRRYQVAAAPQGPPGAAGGSASFQNGNPTTITVGGIPAGSTFATIQTVQQMFDALLYPFQAPAFTGFGISGVGSPLEVGASFGPSVTFTWSTSQSGNVAANSVSITDTTLSTTILSAIANNGTHGATLGAAVTRSSAGTHSFGISATDIHSSTLSGSLTISWLWRRYFGANASTTLSAAQILALSGSGLAGGYNGSYAMAAGGYKFLCLADAAGSQLNTVKDAATQLAIPMVAGSHTDGGGYGYELVSVTNGFGVTTNVRVYRTLNALGGAVQMVVT